MFKKFSKAEDVASNTAIKSSHQRSIRTKLLEQMPLLGQAAAFSESSNQSSNEVPSEESPTLLETLWPKKEGLTLVKCREHVSILALKGQPLFFQHFDGPYYPTLRLLHQYPDLLPRVQVDKGAIKFVLSGANVMCPGLTSRGGSLPTPAVPSERAVAIFAESKDLPCAIGLTKMGTDDIARINKGIGVDNIHYLGDDLWLNGKDL